MEYYFVDVELYEEIKWSIYGGVSDIDFPNFWNYTFLYTFFHLAPNFHEGRSLIKFISVSVSLMYFLSELIKY